MAEKNYNLVFLILIVSEICFEYKRLSVNQVLWQCNLKKKKSKIKVNRFDLWRVNIIFAGIMHFK